MSKYDSEVKARWEDTNAYKEHREKTVSYTKEKWKQVNEGLDSVLAKFAECMKSGCTADSDDSQALVKKLQAHITENFYDCTDEILAGLGQMYVCDERFKNNIDRHGTGNAEFISEAIKNYYRN